jgi:hypothetical protein
MGKTLQNQQKDIYMKVVLTVIALALVVIALNPWIAPKPVEAQVSVLGRDSSPVALHYISPAAVADLVHALEQQGGLPVKK